MFVVTINKLNTMKKFKIIYSYKTKLVNLFIYNNSYNKIKIK